jgi:chromosome segregation ATPase
MTTPTIEHVPTVEDFDTRIAALDDQLAELTTEQADIEKQIAQSWDHPNQTALLQTRYNHVTVLLRGGAIRRQQLVDERAGIDRQNQLARAESLRKDMQDRNKVIEGKQAEIAKLREQINVITGEISNLNPELTTVTNRFFMLYRKLLDLNDPVLSKALNDLIHKYQ